MALHDSGTGCLPARPFGCPGHGGSDEASPSQDHQIPFSVVGFRETEFRQGRLKMLHVPTSITAIVFVLFGCNFISTDSASFTRL
jgi:hypothetical protein